MGRILFLLLISTTGFATEDLAPYWEYGVGLGFARFEQYPSAGEYTDLLLPFPTFQFRGKILRADDREGAKAYLLKGSRWSIEMSGVGYPAMEAKDNRARKGMDDLPWLLALGPQIVYKFNEDLDFSAGAFQAIATDFEMTRFSGGIFQGKFSYRVDRDINTSWIGDLKSTTHYFLNFKWASRDLMKIYYDVKADEVTAERGFYKARAGYLATELSLFQSWKKGRASYYVGLNYSDYANSANRSSFLHKSNSQLSWLVGVTYVLGESRQAEVPEDQTSGIINKRKKTE